MKSTGNLARGICVFAWVCGFILQSSGADNSWINPNSFGWTNAASWSLGILPDATQSVYITNSWYKAVGIFPDTPMLFPASMTVSDLTVSAPDGYLSTLLLNYFGTNAPLTVLGNCTVGTNGTIQVLHSGMTVSGSLGLEGGSLIQDGGFLHAGYTYVFGGFMNLNGEDTFGDVNIDGATIAQSGGFIVFTNLDVDWDGNYVLTNGVLEGVVSIGREVQGKFIQYGGTNLTGAQLGNGEYGEGGTGSYELYGGTVEGSVALGTFRDSHGSFSQDGGSVFATGYVVVSYGSYWITAGNLISGGILIEDGVFTQMGGVVSASGSIFVSGVYDPSPYGESGFADFVMSGGVAHCGGIGVGVFSSYVQVGGTNEAVGTVYVSGGNINLYGGVLHAGNVSVGGSFTPRPGGLTFYSSLTQSNGVLLADSGVSIAGSYALSAGTLSAPTIDESGLFAISGTNTFITNSQSIRCAGTLTIQNASVQLGRLDLATNSTVGFGASPVVLRFLASGAAAWESSSTLSITGWVGSIFGGGGTRLIFGSDGSGVTPEQLARIMFVNPAGFPAGNYPAQILGTGEVVPSISGLPVLSLMIPENAPVISWSGAYTLQRATNVTGPFVDLPTATSPYTGSVSEFPQAFFRLRSQ